MEGSDVYYRLKAGEGQQQQQTIVDGQTRKERGIDGLSKGERQNLQKIQKKIDRGESVLDG